MDGRSLISLLILCALFVGCDESQPAEPDYRPSSYSLEEEEETPEIKSQEHTEEDRPVGYSNPSTGYTSDYELDVEYNSDGSVDRVKFPNGGWEDDWSDQSDNGDGTLTLTDEDGREFTVPKGGIGW